VTSRPHNDEPTAAPSNRRSHGVVPLVAGISTVMAFVADSASKRPLGDEPFGMLVLACLLAAFMAATSAASPMLVGAAAMAGFPIWSLVDLALHGGHNLLPFEFAIYGVYMLIGVAVAMVSAWLWRAKKR